MTMVPATGKKKKEKRRKNVNFKLKKKKVWETYQLNLLHYLVWVVI